MRSQVYVAPVALVAAVGMAWIVFHADSGRGQAHTLFQIHTTLVAGLLRAAAVGCVVAVGSYLRARPKKDGPDERSRPVRLAHPGTHIPPR
ncbi:MAG TPA: hypothetical protein VGA04_23485 [Streptosporangiaceae bacterium]